MSGHSKWSQIKRQKGVADVKKGQVFTKLGMAIVIAVRQGGGISDPESNFKLRLVMEKAREANMPRENIQRAIDKALGKGDAGVLEEVVYEGFGPGNTSVIVEAVTDNHLRTQTEVRNFFDKFGGRFGGQGSVSYQFKKSGMIAVAKNGKTFDDIFAVAVDAGADDVEESNDEINIYTEPHDLHKVKMVVEEKGLTLKNAELIYRPLSLVQIDKPELATKIVDFLNNLEDLDDVQKVYSNVDIVI